MSLLWRDISPYVSTTARSPAGGSINRRGVLVAGLALAGVLVASGVVTAPAGAADAAGSANEAKKFIDDLANKGIALMADKSLSDAQRTQRFRDLFIASFDLPAIGQLVLGRYWRVANPDQQTRFLKLFEEQEVLVWGSRLKSYNGERLIVESAEPDTTAGGWLVQSHIDQHQDQRDSQPVGLEWKVSRAPAGWRVHDLVLEGSSMALTLREDFSSVLQANGGKIDALLTAMQKKVGQLGGTG